MQQNTHSLYEEYKQRYSKIADLSSTLSLMRWDQEVYMPTGGSDFRARNVGFLSGMIHEWSTDQSLGEILTKLSKSKDLDEKQKVNIQKSLTDFNKSKKYPSNFVIKESEAVSKAYQAWIEARRAKDFKIFAKPLHTLVDLKKEETDFLGYDTHPYNALLDNYEKGMTVEKLDTLFADLLKSLKPFLKRIFSQPKPKNDFMFGHFPKDKQWNFGVSLMKQAGFDFSRGRQDISEHPFTSSFNVDDVRLTTRIDESNFYFMLWSCLHECGHGLYEQGLNKSEYGLPLGKSVSLGIHESQSRLYENNLGRSLNYWKYNFPELQRTFPEQFKQVTAEDFFKAANLVEPSPIRTEADELTYHFHILIRYEIEKELIAGNIKVNDLEEVWNEKYKQYLGIEIKNVNEGVLQDIHWSHGGFGYFPTYSLGSFYAAQFFEKAKEEIQDLDELILKGELIPLLEWLRKNIHQRGAELESEPLCKAVTGNGLDFKFFMQYAEEKYKQIYNI